MRSRKSGEKSKESLAGGRVSKSQKRGKAGKEGEKGKSRRKPRTSSKGLFGKNFKAKSWERERLGIG